MTDKTGGKTLLYQIAPTGNYMMSFVIVTKENNAIVIDGGRPSDMPRLKEYIGGRKIKAWIMTHPHEDHLGGLVSELERNGGADFDVEAFYYNFPSYEKWSRLTERDVPCYSYFMDEINELLPAFLRVFPLIESRAHVVTKGDSVTIDECRIDFLYSFRDGMYSNPINDASLAFKLVTPRKSVMFLGDLGADGGDVLFEESGDLLRADIVQMAHHGHMNVGFEVYAAIAPTVCLWCCPDWLYEEKALFPQTDFERIRKMKRSRLFGTEMTRAWMDMLGVREHYVSKDGTHEIEL